MSTLGAFFDALQNNTVYVELLLLQHVLENGKGVSPHHLQLHIVQAHLQRPVGAASAASALASCICSSGG